MSERPRRRIVLFFDGTWNEDEDVGAPTNIVRIREALKIGVDRALDQEATSGRGARSDKVSGSILDGSDGKPIEYVVYYDRGVGTGAWLDPIKGGAFGDGLDHNIRQAYRFLSEHYAHGDEILVFGFSRGAFTARSLVGYLFATGLLRPDACDAAREGRAWAHYRTSPGDRYCAEWLALKPYMFDRDILRITCLGVFDTVGALGIPLEGFRRANAEKFAFHNTELSSIVDVSLQAVAIDEHRRSFEPALWQKPKFKRFPNARIEQVWFAGAHADIGGGYSAWGLDGARRSGRQDIAYAWMMARLRHHIPGIHLPDLTSDGPFALRVDPAAADGGVIHRPWATIDLIRKPACRTINQIPPLPGRWKTVGAIPHAEPINEAVHISALRLLRAPTVASERGAASVYRPANLLAALPAIAATYRLAAPDVWEPWRAYTRLTPGGETAEPELCVVDDQGLTFPRSAAPGDRDGLSVLNLITPLLSTSGFPVVARQSG